MSKAVGLPGQPGWTRSETEAEFISREPRASPRALLAGEGAWHEAADNSAALVWRRLGILGSQCELFICGSWMPVVHYAQNWFYSTPPCLPRFLLCSSTLIQALKAGLCSSGNTALFWIAPLINSYSFCLLFVLTPFLAKLRGPDPKSF